MIPNRTIHMIVLAVLMVVAIATAPHAESIVSNICTGHGVICADGL